MLISSFSFYLIGFLKEISWWRQTSVCFLTVPLNSRTSLIQCEESQRQVNSHKFLKLCDLVRNQHSSGFDGWCPVVPLHSDGSSACPSLLCACSIGKWGLSAG